MSTGENDQALRKILDFTRMGSLMLLGIHFYISCYGVFKQWGLTQAVVERIIINISKLPVFRYDAAAKSAALLLLLISVVGSKGRKDENIRVRTLATYFAIGLLLYYGSSLSLLLNADLQLVAVTFMGLCLTGYLFILSAGTQLSRLIKSNVKEDLFNRNAESFPQEERLLENEYSINLPTKYQYQGKVRQGLINIVNGFRGTLVLGTPGSC